MAAFENAIRPVLEREGVRFDEFGIAVKTGYYNHPDDSGGETNWGITTETARDNGYTGPMLQMPYPTALSIYRHRYWYPIRGDDIPDQAIAEELLDTGINAHPSVAVRFLQETLNVLNRKAELWPDIAEDGKMGPATIGALKVALATAADYGAIILKTLNCLQGAHYVACCKRDEKKESFFAGWLRWRVSLEGR